MNSSAEFAINTKIVRAFVRWLEQHDQRHAENWGHLYVDDREAAMCEATIWAILTDCDVRVMPNRDDSQFPLC